MTGIRFTALTDDDFQVYRSGGADANGQSPERHVSGGPGVPCRHCLTEVAEGEDYLILAHRPFPEPQPYAEVGPIFLHAGDCRRYAVGAELPDMIRGWERILMRGYGQDDRIVYGTGKVVATEDIDSAASALFDRAEIAYIHLRSASNNCYQCRIDRG